MSVGGVASSVGKGLLAGLAGTAAMTVSSTLEAKLSGRGASDTPSQAVQAAFKIRPADDSGEWLLETLGHWGYGTAWGAIRGLLASAGLSGSGAALAHFGIVWGGEQAVMPLTGVGSPTPAYGVSATATDVFHHAVYAAATSAAYEWIDRH